MFRWTKNHAEARQSDGAQGPGKTVPQMQIVMHLSAEVGITTQQRPPSAN